MPAHAKRYDAGRNTQPDDRTDEERLAELADRCVALNKKIARKLGFKYVPAIQHGPFFPDRQR